MDKLLKRVRMAERQVARRAKKEKRTAELYGLAEQRQQVQQVRKEVGLNLKTAIKNRHEDWKLGPLAPRRDVSRAEANTGIYWGSISADRAQLSVNLTQEQKEARAAWAGGPQYLCLAKGDRVVVLDGPYKGKISTIKNIHREKLLVDLGDDLLFNQAIPEFMRPEDTDPVEPHVAPIPVSSIRLVHPLPDPKTGVVRDVIIRQLKAIGIVHDRPTRTVSFSRIVPGENVKIPWPKAAPRSKVEHEGDTARADLEARTFVPTLLRPPMPESVLDELRGRYSRFRTRHTPEYIAQKEAEEAEKQARKGSVQTMLLPVQELNRKLRAERRARGQPELTEEMLEKIGQVIAKNRELRASGKSVEVDRVQSAVEQLSIDADVSEAEYEDDLPRPS